MNIRPIRNATDYERALGELSAYFDHEPKPGSAEGDRFDILTTLVEAYETAHYPIEDSASSKWPAQIDTRRASRCNAGTCQRRTLMKTRIGGTVAACVVALTLGLACGPAGAQSLGSLGGKLGGLLPGGGESGSMGNVAGILEYCVKNNYLGGESGAAGIANKLLGKTKGGANNSDYANGVSGILKGKNGSTTNLASLGGGNSDLKSKLTTKACDIILKQGKSFLGHGGSSSLLGKAGSIFGH